MLLPNIGCARVFVGWVVGGVFVTVGDDDFLAGLVPLAVVVDAGEGADGSDDGVGGRDDALGLFDQEAEGVAGLFGSEVEEAEGLSVSVNNAAVGEIEFVGDDGWAVPVKDGLLDGVAFGVIADRAVRDVAEEGAVFVFVSTSDTGFPKTRTLSRDRKGCGTRNVRFNLSLGTREIPSRKIRFQFDLGLRRIGRVRFNRNVCVHLSFLWSFEFGAGQSGLVWCGERRRRRRRGRAI